MAKKVKWYKTGSKETGFLYYKQHPTRKHGVKYDRYFRTEYQFKGKRKAINFGWLSDGWTEIKCLEKLNFYKNNARNGSGPTTLREEIALREAEKQAKQDKQEQEEKNNMLLSTYFKKIYYPAISQEKKESSHVREESLFRLWIKPTMGNKSFKNISVFDLERLKKNMLKKGKAPRSVEYALTTLGQIFRHAERLDYFQGDIPTTKVKKPKYDNKRVKFLSHDEAHKLFKILKEKSQETYKMALLSLHCGLRAGEVFSLTWKDIDLEHDLITILDTKNKSKNRVVSMTADVKTIFNQMKPKNKNNLIFPDRKTGGVRKQISKSFPRAVEKAEFNNGIDDRRQKVTFHTLRHTFASWLVMEGISLYEVKELLGHASLIMTERYSHLAPDRNKKAAETMERVFQKNKKEKKRKMHSARQGKKIKAV